MALRRRLLGAQQARHQVRILVGMEAQIGTGALVRELIEREPPQHLTETQRNAPYDVVICRGVLQYFADGVIPKALQQALHTRLTSGSV